MQFAIKENVTLLIKKVLLSGKICTLISANHLDSRVIKWIFCKNPEFQRFIYNMRVSLNFFKHIFPLPHKAT